jgi:signal transduction histidine kinase
MTTPTHYQNSIALALSIVVPYLMMESLRDRPRHHLSVVKISILTLLITFSLSEFITPLLSGNVLNFIEHVIMGGAALALSIWSSVQWTRQSRPQYLVIFVTLFIVAGSLINNGVLVLLAAGGSEQVSHRDWALGLILLASLVVTIARLSLDFEALSNRYLEDTQNDQRARSDRIFHASLSYLDQSRSISILSSTLAHELNQPITAVATNAELLTRYMPREDMQDVLLGAAEDIERDLLRANDLLDQYLKKRVTDPVTGEACDVVDVVKQVHRWFASDFEAANVRFDVMNNLAISRVQMSELQLNQVLSNLIRNSLEALKSAVSKDKNIAITLSPGKDAIVIALSDNGPGVPSGQIAHLEKAMRSKKAGGMGLGLSISRWIVERHGGSFSIWSNLGGGFHVQMSLPTERPCDV